MKGEHIGHHERKTFRCPQKTIQEAQEWARRHPGSYDNFSHYVRVALVRQNRRHRKEAGVDGVEEALRK